MEEKQLWSFKKEGNFQALEGKKGKQAERIKE